MTAQKPYFDDNQTIEKIVAFFNERYAGHLQLENQGRTIAARLIGPDGELLLSSLEPIRPQLARELHRLGTFCNCLAMHLADDDWCDAEADADETRRDVEGAYGGSMVREAVAKVAAA